METIAEAVISRKVIRKGNIPVAGPELRLGPLIPDGYEEINREVVQATTCVYEKLGPGFHEGVYQACMAHDLARRGLHVRREIPFLLEYEGLCLNNAFRLDLVVEEKIVIMIHTHQRESEFFTEQLRTYLRHSGYKYGLLINFNTGLRERGLKPVLP